MRDLPAKVTKELKWQLQGDPVAEKWFYESFGLAPPEESRDPQVLEDLEILFPETPLILLKDVFDALQLCDLVDLLEKEKPRTLRPSLPLRDIRIKPNYSNRPTRFYSKAAVLTIGTGTLGQIQGYTQRIGSFFKEFNSRSKVTTISVATYSQVFKVLREWREIKENFESGDTRWFETRLKRELQWFKEVLNAEEAEELERYVEMRKLNKKDRKLAFEKRINQTMEELQTESEKFEMSLGQWITRKGWLKLRLTPYLIRTRVVSKMGILPQSFYENMNSGSTLSKSKIPDYARDYRNEYLFIRGIDKQFKYFVDNINDAYHGLFLNHRVEIIKKHIERFELAQRLGWINDVSNFEIDSNDVYYISNIRLKEILMIL